MIKSHSGGDLMEDRKIKVLFVCGANSFRSQVAMTLLNGKYGDRFIGESAGYKLKPISLMAIKAMAQYGYDIANNPSNRIIDIFNQGRVYDYVITVCNEKEENDCPVFPGSSFKLHWREFPNPENYQGDEAQKFGQAMYLVEAMEKKIDAFVATVE